MFGLRDEDASPGPGLGFWLELIGGAALVTAAALGRVGMEKSPARIHRPETAKRPGEAEARASEAGAARGYQR